MFGQNPPFSRRTAVRLLPAAALVASLVPLQAARAQVIPNPAAQVRVVVNIPGQVPLGVTRYRVELRCVNVRGIPAPGAQNLVDYVDRNNGSTTFTVNTQPGTNCRFRLAVEGTGSRPLSGTAMHVGGSPRTITVLSTVDGQPVDPNTVLESVDVPIEASTEAVWGTFPVVAPTTTTTTTTTTTSTTTTTRPPTPTTAPVVTSAPAPVTAPTVAPTTAVPVRWKIVRTTRCASRYRFVEIGSNRVVRCLTSAEVKRYVPGRS